MLSRRLKKKILLWIGKLAATVSCVLLIAISCCFIFKPDSCAALTFFPPWAWGLLGITLAIFSVLYNKRILIISVIGWLIFILVFAEEPKSLPRGCFISNKTWQNISAEKKITVISLNCAGGNMQAAREVLPYKPDIVLLQEIPSDKEDLTSLARELFENNFAIAYGPDTAIIARGKLQQTPLARPLSMFMTQALVRLNSGIEIEVISTRLAPPTIEINLLSANCWAEHREDRKSRRKQIAQIVEQLNQVPKNHPIILGGDFNVSANDGCLEGLKSHLKDTFAQRGVGWGHTAINAVPLFRVDQIWADSHFKPFSVFSRKTKHSDHRMVICRLVKQ